MPVTISGPALTLIVVGVLLLLGIAVATLVITTRRLERAGLLHATREAELRGVQDSLTEAILVFDPDGRLVSRNPAADRLYEINELEWPTVPKVSKWEFLREDGSILPAEERPLAVVMRTGATSERVIVGMRKRADEAVKWLSFSTVPIRGPGSKVSGYVSSARDISETRQTFRELQVVSRASEQLSSSLVPDQVIRALTKAANDLCSAPGEERRRALLFVIDGPTMTVTGEHDPASSLRLEGVGLPIAEHPYIQRVIATHQGAIAELHYDEFGPAVADVMRRAELKNCVWLPMTRNNRVFAVLSVAGRQHALISSAQLKRLETLVTLGQLALSNAELHEQVAQLARTDPLTGVGNRRALDDRLARLPRSRFALVAVDVDDLKKVNDAHGHVAGDELLARLAAALSAELRPSDLLARTGGDEFMALLVDCDAHGAVELGRRLQLAARQLHFAWGSPSISVGSAAGAAGDSPREIAKAADLVLYAAKQATKLRAASQSAVAVPSSGAT
jgi:diguanylate cyclase (GGDEF)-like protein/PAS domain S-box-containing protein